MHVCVCTQHSFLKSHKTTANSQIIQHTQLLSHHITPLDNFWDLHLSQVYTVSWKGFSAAVCAVKQTLVIVKSSCSPGDKSDMPWIWLLNFLGQKLVDAQYQCKNSSIFHCWLFVCISVRQRRVHAGFLHQNSQTFEDHYPILSLFWSCMHNLNTLKVLWHTNLTQVWEWL